MSHRRTIKRTIKWKGDVADSASYIPAVPAHSKQQESRLLLYRYFNQSPSSCLGKGELKLKAESELRKVLAQLMWNLLSGVPGLAAFKKTAIALQIKKYFFPHSQPKFPAFYMSHISKSKSSKHRYWRSAFSEGLIITDRLWRLQNLLIRTKFGFTSKYTFCNSHNMWQDPHSSGLPYWYNFLFNGFNLLRYQCCDSNSAHK